MPHAELVAWSEYAQVEPFGSHFDDLRSGAIAAAIYNVARDTEKHPKPFAPLDFTPWNALSDENESSRKVIVIDDPELASQRLDQVLFGLFR